MTDSWNFVEKVEMNDRRHTERLLVRRPESQDQSGYRNLLLDPAVGEWLRPGPLEPFDDAKVLGMLSADEGHWREHGFGPWVLIERKGGSMVGRGGIQWTELDGEWAVELPWTVASEHWKQGLGTEAATAAVDWASSLGFPEVVALILPDNIPSRRVAEKVGFDLDGETRHAGLLHLLYRLSLARPD
jgi:RimJ/RimL family protein N-acetyltransferase